AQSNNNSSFSDPIDAIVTVIELSDSDKDSDDDVVIIDDPTKSHQRRREGHGDGLVWRHADSRHRFRRFRRRRFDCRRAAGAGADSASASADIPEPTAAGVSIPPASKVRRLDNGEAAFVDGCIWRSCWCRTASGANGADLLEKPYKVHVGESVFALRDQDEWCRAVVTHELPRDAYVVRFLGAPTLAANQQPTQPQPQLSRTMALGDSCLTRQERCRSGTRWYRPSQIPTTPTKVPTPRPTATRRLDTPASTLSRPRCTESWLRASTIGGWLGRRVAFFIRDYLDAYPTRDLLRLQPGQAVVAELRGGWHNARVEAVDGALIRLTFMHDGSCEWVSCGSGVPRSTRLKTLYDRLYGPPKQQQQQPKQKPVQVQVSAAVVASQARVGHARKSTSASRLASSKSTANAAEDDDDFVYIGSTGRRRRRRDNGDSDDDSVAQDAAYRGRQVATFDPESPCPQPRLYRPHRCSPSCCPRTLPAACPALLPSMTPLLGSESVGGARSAWLVATAGAGRDDDGGVGGGGGGGGGVGGPAGRGANHADLDAYLRETCCRLHVSAFCFDAAVRINNEFQPLKIIYQLKDISYGKEPVPVSAREQPGQHQPALH
uniref:Tudor_4 domain-containing protein n=1 Tax=Macrostomum lignano TaxID=282301 RepID=A0A1I8F3C7_9PLAT